MQLFTLCLLSGTALFQFSSSIPSRLYLLAALLTLLTAIWKRWPLPVMGMLFGWSWAFVFALLNQPADIDLLNHKTTYQARGTVIGLPHTGNGKTRFLFEVESLLDEHGIEKKGRWRVRVSWRKAEPVVAGQQWQLALRLKQAQNYSNPGSWDYTGWLYRQGVRYTAYVRDNAPYKKIGRSDCCLIDRLRAYFRLQLDRQNLSPDVRAVIIGLALGERSEMSSSLKQTFSLTGTSHLMAISGLHISLVAGLFAWIVNNLWRRMPYLCRRYPAALAGVLAGLMVAFIYALISGFDIPAQRSLIMLAVAAFAIVQRRRYRPFDMLAVALLAVLLHDPMAVMLAGFWLSFIAVVAILLVLKSLQGYVWWKQAIAVQLGISLALYPVLLLFGLPQSMLSPLVNLLLVPLFGFLIVPLSLLSVMLSPLLAEGSLVFWVLQGVLAPVLDFLYWLSNLSLPKLSSGYWSGLRLAILAVAVAITLSPFGRAFRGFGLVVLFSVHMPMQPIIEKGAYRLTLLDVGQGLSVVVQTHQHTLVYDTGAAYRSGFTLADAVVLPYLQAQGISRLDHLILSHGDNDHAGGARLLTTNIPVRQVSSGESGRLNVSASSCYAGQRWQWDDVDFEILHPDPRHNHKGNDASCVLLIRNKAGSSLLPGDIEASAEKSLISTLQQVAPFKVVIASHHGSKSSSIPEFVEAVNADYVLYAVGRNNRYGFPRKQIVQRWQDAGARSLRSDFSGAMSFYFSADGKLSEPQRFRPENIHYWHFASDLTD